MALDIFDHPSVVRLLEGEPILASELREALVDFWKANETFAICADCKSTIYVRGIPEEKRRPRGCCGGCPSFIEDKGCGQRNLACLFFTCVRVSNHLKDAGVWENFEFLHQLIAKVTYRREPYYNSCRLPARARLYIVDMPKHNWDWDKTDGVCIDSDYEGVRRDRLEQDWNRRT